MEDKLQTGTDFLGFEVKPNEYVFYTDSWEGPTLYKINHITPKGVNASLAFSKPRKKKKNHSKWLSKDGLLIASKEQIEAYKIKMAELNLSGERS